MFLRVLSKKLWFRDSQGNKVKMLKRSDGSQNALCFKWKNGITYEELPVTVKMVPKSWQEKENAIIKHNLISTDQDTDLIFADIGNVNLSFLMIDSDGVISPVSFDNLGVEESILQYEDGDYCYADIENLESFEKALDETSGSFANHVIHIPEGYGIIVNDLFITA
jgi:hypothetical protein